MQIIKQHWAKILLVLVIFIQLIYYLSVSQRPNIIAPKDRVYNVLGKNFYYPSMIRQAKDGSWGIKDTHTTRKTPVVYAQLFFVIAGKIAAIFSIDPVVMFQLLKATGAIVSTLFIYFFLRIFLTERWAVAATLLAACLESGPNLKTFMENVYKLSPVWDSQIIFERRFALPHHTWGDAFAFIFFGLLFFILLKPIKSKEKTLLYTIMLFFSGWWATTTLPSFILPYFMLSLPAGLYLIFKQKIPLNKVLLPIGGALLGIFIAVIILKLEFSKGSPWTEWTAEEKSWMKNDQVVSQYLQALLLYFPLILAGIIGTVLRFKQMTVKVWVMFILSLSWILGPIPLIYLSQYTWFPFANFRLVDLHGYVPAAILGCIGFWHTLSIFKSNKFKTIAAMTIGFLIFLVSSALTFQYTKNIYSAQEYFASNIYPSSLTWQGVLFMENLPNGSNIMVREYFGEMLPAFGPVSSYIGGGHGFKDWIERQWISQNFYKGLLSDQEALNLLASENITHVFWGPDEKYMQESQLFYPNILEAIFSNQDVTIFVVNYK